MDEDTIKNLIAEEIKKVTAFSHQKTGDTPTDALQLVPKKYADTKVQKGLVTAKGDLLVGSSASVIGTLPVGTNGQYLMSNSSASLGVQWASVLGGSVGIFGDGSSGDLSISSGTTTLTSDAYYNNLTLTGTAVLNPAGYRVFVKNILTIGTNGGSDTCQILRTGISGSPGVTGTQQNGGAGGGAGSVLGGITLPDGNPGTNGINGATSPNNIADEAGSNGNTATVASSVIGSIGSAGGTGATAGNGGAYAGFAGGIGTGGSNGGTVTRPSNVPSSLFDTLNLWNPKTFTLHKGSAGPGGSGGSGSGGHAANSIAGGGGGSGGGGGDGGFLAVYANTIINYVAGGIQAKGGIGGAGGTGNNATIGSGIGAAGGGGGAGGNGGTGGIVIIVYKNLTQSGSFLASGGAGGTGGAGGNFAGANCSASSSGNNGVTGNSGVVWALQAI